MTRPTDKTDEELLLDLIKGNSKAFDEIYMRYVPHVEAFAYCMLKDKAEAEDLAHDLFLKIWVHKSSLSNIRSFRNYLFRMTKNAIFDRYEHKAVDIRYRKISERIDIQDLVTEDITAKVDLQDLLLLVNLAIEKMPPQRQRIFRMSRLDGIPQHKIACELGISPKTVEYHIRVALSELRKLIQILIFFL